MRWEDERYVRLYTRDTVDWLALGWEGQALFVFILRKVDRAGVLELGRGGARGLAAMFQMPLDVLERSLALLLQDGCLEQVGSTLVVRNFIEAQEAAMSPNARKAESRLKQRDLIRAGIDPRQRGTVVYFIQSEHGGSVKIGRADDLAKRLVGLQTSRPDKLVVLAAAPGTVQQERDLHQRFAALREKGEWFSPSQELMDFVREVAASGELPVAVTGHETRPVTPSRAVPCRAEPAVLKGAGAVAPRAPEEFQLQLSKPIVRGRHAVLQDRLLATYERVTGEKYEHAGGKDAKAIAKLAKSERTDDAIDALWSFSVATAPAYPFTRSLAQFVSKLGDIVAAVNARDPWRADREVGRTREERGDCAACGPSLQVFDVWGQRLCTVCVGAWNAEKVEPNEAATAAWVQERRKEQAA
jgi:hypothetical protein